MSATRRQGRPVGLVFLSTLCALLALLALPGRALPMVVEPSGGPWIATDKDDYQPGETVTISGGGWAAGEAVRIVVNDTLDQSWSQTHDVTADDTGAIVDRVVLPSYFVSDYGVTATGAVSGVATTDFTDTLTAIGATVNGASSAGSGVVFPIVVGPGDPIPAGLTTTVASGEPNAWQATRWTVGAATACQNAGAADDHFVNGTHTERFTMTAPTGAATYSPVFQPFDSGTCASGTGGSTTTLAGAVRVDPAVLFSEYFGSASSDDVPFWNDQNQAADSDCAVAGPLAENYFAGLQRGCTISTTNANSRPITTAGRQNVRVRFTWGKNAIPSGSTNSLDLFWKLETETTWRGPLCQTGQTSCSSTVSGIGSGSSSPTANAVDVTLPAAAAGGSIDIRFRGNTSSAGNLRLDAVRVLADLTQAPLAVTGPASGTYGQSYEITTSGGSGTGALSFSVGSSTACAIDSADGSRVRITSGTGSCAVTATKAGDGTYAATTSAPFPVSVAKASQAVTFTSAAPSDATVGDRYTPQASGGASGNPVTFDASGACAYDSGSVTMTGAGTCTVTADQAGTANYSAAAQASQAFSVTRASQATLVVTGPSAGTYNASYAITTSGGSGTGALSFSVGASTACAIDATNPSRLRITSGTGTCTLTATKAGDATYRPATSAPFTVTVSKANQTAISVTAPSAGTYGDRLAMTASGGSTGGALSFDVTSDSTACSILTSGTDTGKLSIDSGTGTCRITATRAGNADYEDVSSPAHTVTVSKAVQAALAVTSPTSGRYGDRLAMAASGGSSGGTLSFDVTSDSTACSIVTSGTDTGKLSIDSGVGLCRITATRAGNANYLDVTSPPLAVTVSKASQTITFGALPNRTYGDPSFSLAATGGTSGNAVTYALAAGSVGCSLSGANDAMVTITGATGAGQKCAIVASQAGSANYEAATSVTRDFVIAKAVLSVTAANRTMTYADAMPTFTYGMSGFAHGETEAALRSASPAALTGSVTFSTSPLASSSSGAGTYAIVPDVGALGAANYTFVARNGTLTIQKRQSLVVYGGTNYVAIPSAGTATVNVAARVSRTAGSAGNLALARVQFVVRKFSGAVQATVYAMADANGDAATTAPVPTSDDPYTVEVQIDPANGYWTSGVDVASLQVIVGSGTGRTAGGGWIPDAANAINGKSNFGFTVQNAKTGIKGNSLFIYRVREVAGEVQYVVKSNSWQGGGLTFRVNNDPKRATFTGKATVQRYVNGVVDATFNSGGHSFTVDGLDGDLASPRVADGYAITVRNGSNQIVKQLGSRAAPVTLGGGNVLVQAT